MLCCCGTLCNVTASESGGSRGVIALTQSSGPVCVVSRLLWQKSCCALYVANTQLLSPILYAYNGSFHPMHVENNMKLQPLAQHMCIACSELTICMTCSVCLARSSFAPELNEVAGFGGPMYGSKSSQGPPRRLATTFMPCATIGRDVSSCPRLRSNR